MSIKVSMIKQVVLMKPATMIRFYLLMAASSIPAIDSSNVISHCTIDVDFCTGLEVQRGQEWLGKSFGENEASTMLEVERKAHTSGTSCTFIVENYSKWDLILTSDGGYTKISGHGMTYYGNKYPPRNVKAATKEIMLATVK